MRLLVILLSVLLVIEPQAPPLAGAATINKANDYIDSDAFDETGVNHSVNFQIPTGGHTIVPSDYIRITLTDYSAVTAPNSGGGWSGTPTYGVSGNIAHITNVSASPDDWITIGGITATNPSSGGSFDVTIDVASDLAGTIVYDSVTITATPIKGISTASVTKIEPTATLNLIGFAMTDGFITITLNGSIAGTTSANSSGNFSKTITGITPGTYSIGLYAQDLNLVTSETVSYVLELFAGTTHTLNNIVIPPTIEIDKPTLTDGDVQNISGYAKPSSDVTIYVNSSPQYQNTVQAQASGVYSLGFNTTINPLSVGAHTTYSQQIVTGGYQSTYSNVVGFNVIANCIDADINCDGYVNLTDFSIMLFHWQKTNPTNPRADIDKDNVVNLTDFSILLFYWTG